MARVIGLDVPSKHYDTFHTLFGTAFWQDPKEKGTVIKKGSWKFPGYPFHPKFPSPAQLYVRAIFKSATECWHLQPDTGGGIKPDYGPIPREWWENEAHKARTYPYRKFMRDTLLQKFRVGEPTWCIEYFVPATFVEYDRPDTNFCEEWSLFCHYEWMHRHWWTYLSRPPEDYGKEFLYLYAHHVYPSGSEQVFLMSCIPEPFAFDPCTLTWNTRPSYALHTDILYVIDPGWYRFWVGAMGQIYIRPYFKWFNVLDPNFYGGVVFWGPNAEDVALRPFFSHD